jgi:hypothetical protein
MIAQVRIDPDLSTIQIVLGRLSGVNSEESLRSAFAFWTSISHFSSDYTIVRDGYYGLEHSKGCTMADEERGFIFGILDEECSDLPSIPQVDILLRIIREHPGRTRMELWNSLPFPKGMNYSAFSNILCALLKRNLIVADGEGHYSWIGNPEPST